MRGIARIAILFFFRSSAAADREKNSNIYSSIFGLEVVAAANDQEVMEHVSLLCRMLIFQQIKIKDFFPQVSNGTAAVLSPGGEGAWNLLLLNSKISNPSEVVASSFPIRYEEIRVATAARQ